jgi:DNA polymerase III subunit delta
MIIFLYGDDTFRSRKKLIELKEKFKREVDPSGNSLVTLDGGNINIEKINEVINTSSLFANKRMVIIENIFFNKSKSIFDQLKDALSNKDKKDSENIIIFLDYTSDDVKKTNKLFQFLKKQKYSQNFKSFSNTEATNWVKKTVEERGGKIKHQAALALVSLLANNLWQISNEINKLINYKNGQACLLQDGQCDANINEEDVERLVRGKFDENIFNLTDAISNKNKALAVKLFEQEIDAGLTESYLIHMIIRQFRILLQVRQGLDNGWNSRKIISQLKQHPFVVQKCMTQVRNFSLDILKNILHNLVLIDKSVKSGRGEVKSAINLLTIKM